MVDTLLVIGAIILSVYFARGILDTHARGGYPVWGWHSMTAWAGVCGGGVYAVGLVDSTAIAHFSWLYITIIIAATWVCLWFIRADREYRELVGVIINSSIGERQDEAGQIR